MIVTLSAAYGAGGGVIGRELADRLDVPFCDRAIAMGIAHHLDVSVIPALTGSQLARRVSFPDDQTLVLSALEPSALSGKLGLASISWARHPPR